MESNVLDKKVKMSFLKFVKTDDAVFYIIKVSNSDNSINFEFKERYSILRNIHEKFEEEANTSNFPEFPGKKFWNNTDSIFLNQRMKSLENYFTAILDTPKFREMRSVNKWIDYLIIQFNRVPQEEPSQVRRRTSSETNREASEKQNVLETKCKEICDKYSVLFIDHANDNYTTMGEDTEESERRVKEFDRIIKGLFENVSLPDLPEKKEESDDIQLVKASNLLVPLES